eukprot:Clim_evm1s218 gene=Clim_evmTU1s218
MGNYWSDNKEEEPQASASSRKTSSKPKPSPSSADLKPNPNILRPADFVWHRRSSMVMDEDGDMAHEFFNEQVVVDVSHKKPKGPGAKNKKKGKKVETRKVVMKKRDDSTLRPVGMVEMSHPSIRQGVPVVLLDQDQLRSVHNSPVPPRKRK